MKIQSQPSVNQPKKPADPSLKESQRNSLTIYGETTVEYEKEPLLEHT